MVSNKAEITVFPSGVIAIAFNESLLKVNFSFPVPKSQILIVLLFEPEITVFPSGVTAIAFTQEL